MVAELPRNLEPKLSPFEIPQLKLYPSDSADMIDLDQVSSEKRDLLTRWFDQYRDKDVAVFNTWFFKSLGAGNCCMSSKIFYRDAS